MTFKEIFEGWPNSVSEAETNNPEIRHILNQIAADYTAKEKVIFPNKENVFRAFKLTKFDEIRVVIIGQDPYASIYQGNPVATGLAFGINTDSEYKVPASLRNIVKALPENPFRNLNLEEWANQGVLLINTALTVEWGKPGSKIKLWKPFTELVLEAISQHREGVVFVLWGKYAQKYKKYVDKSRHYIVEDIHPAAPAYNPKATFSGKFDEINNYLTNKIIF